MVHGELPASFSLAISAARAYLDSSTKYQEKGGSANERSSVNASSRTKVFNIMVLNLNNYILYFIYSNVRATLKLSTRQSVSFRSCSI